MAYSPDRLTMKILFIEDESALQKTISDLLTREGYEVLSALDGEVGLRLAKSESPDLILLDLVLPRIDGFGVLKFLKGNADLKDIPVIVLTNLEEVGDVEKVLSLGATTYLVKANYSLEDVLEKIQQALNPEIATSAVPIPKLPEL